MRIISSIGSAAALVLILGCSPPPKALLTPPTTNKFKVKIECDSQGGVEIDLRDDTPGSSRPAWSAIAKKSEDGGTVTFQTYGKHQSFTLEGKQGNQLWLKYLSTTGNYQRWEILANPNQTVEYTLVAQCTQNGPRVKVDPEMIIIAN